MSYLLILIWLCLKPYWPVFLGATIGIIATSVLFYQNIIVWGVVATTITSPLVMWGIYLIMRVISEINKPW